MKRKIIAFMCFAGAMTSTITAVAIALTFNHNDDSSENIAKPLQRGDDYEHFYLSNSFDKKELTNKLITTNKTTHERVINKENFRNDINQIVRTTLANTAKFKNNLDLYRFKIHYQFTSDKSVSVDLI
jgi:hypothetical protein